MKYYSTNKQSPIVDFKEATIKGQPPDKGLYFPESLPKLPKDFIDKLPQLSKAEIAFEAIKPFTGETIPAEVLYKIVKETINFDFPLVKINESIFSLELFHGPTLAFKDVGARFMSRCLGYFVKDINRPITVLVATSGDTGGAVASGFYNVEGVNVIILYPSKKVSSVQELQLTTPGKNITAIEVEGTFDDCQEMVKQAFANDHLNNRLFLTSANSINVARWLPQQFYYFFAWQQWQDKANPPVVSVPSGNFGNLCAGIVAHLSGLPVKHFVAAVNANNVVADYLQTGNYESHPAKATISNAMDVGNPSNFVRLLEMFKHKFPEIKKTVTAFSINDDKTRATIVETLKKHNYLLDPHGAVAYAALQCYLGKHPSDKGMILETAHPVKFYDVVEQLIGQQVQRPESILQILNKEKTSIKIAADFAMLKEFLLS